MAGPIRAELLDVEHLEATGLVLRDRELLTRSKGRRVFALPGVPLTQGFLVRSTTTGSGKPASSPFVGNVDGCAPIHT